MLLLGPGMRCDLVIDVPVSGKASFAVMDRFYDGMENTIATLVVAGGPVRDRVADWDMALKPNPLPEPDLDQAIRQNLIYSGGMMGDMILQQMIKSRHITPEMLGRMGMDVSDATGSGDMAGMGGMANMMRSMFGAGNIWAVNGRDPDRDGDGPLVTVDRGQTCHLTLMNATAWLHPIHLHGHAFRLLARNDVAVPYQPWLDTVLIAPGERVEIAFVADNPGDWLIHCHILENKVGGMSGVIRVL
jgi:FtsP/CotA-like multicopper oxidase with cupredoxin domain